MLYTFSPQTFWCGSQESYDYLQSCASKVEAHMATACESDMPDLPPMWQKSGSTAVVNVQGPLVQGDAGFFRYFGVTGYDNIRQAVVEALVDPDVKNIMLHIDSGGGQVAGVSDTAKFLMEAGKIKPLSTFGDGTVASAAYWLGASTQHTTVTDTTVAGSIGVLIVHAERSKQLADAGIGVTVVRAGEFKANTNNIEPLSDAGKATLQNQVDYLYKPFLAHVADRRGVSTEQADKTMAQGRVFIGQQNVDVGLVDAVGTYEDALKTAAALSLPKGDNMQGRRSSKGANAGYDATHLNGDTMKPIIPNNSGTATASASAEGAGAEASQGNTGAAAATPVVPSAPDAVAVLGEQLAKAYGDLALVRQELEAAVAVSASADAKVKAAEATANAFEGIVRSSLATMQVALNLPKTEPASADLLATHNTVSASFAEKFKVGGVAATAQSVDEQKPGKVSAKSAAIFAASIKSASK